MISLLRFVSALRFGRQFCILNRSFNDSVFVGSALSLNLYVTRGAGASCAKATDGFRYLQLPIQKHEEVSEFPYRPGKNRGYIDRVDC